MIIQVDMTNLCKLMIEVRAEIPSSQQCFFFFLDCFNAFF
jgi:hypothetical protein